MVQNSRDAFLSNLRDAVGFLSPRGQVNGIRLGRDYLEAALRRATAWLTPRAVDGFRAEDFPDYGEADRRRLADAVAAFRAAAGRIDAAIGPFLDILDILGPDLEGFDLYRALKRQQPDFPPYVRDFAVRIGEDWSGDPAAWVWIIATDESTVEDYVRDGFGLQRQIYELLDRMGERRILYLGFRGETEQSEEFEGEQLDNLAVAARHRP